MSYTDIADTLSYRNEVFEQRYQYDPREGSGAERIEGVGRGAVGHSPVAFMIKIF